MAKSKRAYAPSMGVRVEPDHKRGERIELPRKLSQARVADHEQMLDQIFRVILEFSGNSGVSAERAARLFANARRTVTRQPYRLSDARNFKVMLHIAEVLKAWYTEPDYLDARGLPAPLPHAGSRSVERLIKRFVPDVNARDTVRWLIAEGVLQRQGRGLLLPARRTISFSQPNAMTLDRIPFLIQGLLSTVSHNTRAKSRGRETRCERMLALDEFPVSELPRFDWEVKRLVPMLLDQLESWATPYLQTAQRKSQKTARVGVEIFGYVEEYAPQRRQS